MFTSTGYLITTLTASDADEGLNAEIIFVKDSQSQFPPSEDADIFRLERSTGELTVNKELDRERAARYVILVKAIDRGSPTQVSGSEWRAKGGSV